MENIVSIPSTAYFLQFDGRDLQVVDQQGKRLISYDLGLATSRECAGILLHEREIILFGGGAVHYFRNCAAEPCPWAQNMFVSAVFQIDGKLFAIGSGTLFLVEDGRLQILRQMEEDEIVVASMGSALVVKLRHRISRLEASGAETLITKCMHDKIVVRRGGILGLGISEEQIDRVIQRSRDAEAVLQKQNMASGIQYEAVVYDEARAAARRQKLESLLFINVFTGFFSQVTDPKIVKLFQPEPAPELFQLDSTGLSLNATVAAAIFQNFTAKKRELAGQQLGRLRTCGSEIFQFAKCVEEQLSQKQTGGQSTASSPRQAHAQSEKGKSGALPPLTLTEAEQKLKQSIEESKARAAQQHVPIPKLSQASIGAPKSTQSSVSSSVRFQPSQISGTSNGGLSSQELERLSDALVDVQTFQDELGNLERQEEKCRQEMQGIQARRVKLQEQLQKTIAAIHEHTGSMRSKIDRQ